MKKFPEKVLKIPCAAHRLNLCVKDLFKEKHVFTKRGRKFIKDYNEDDELRDREISPVELERIEEMNGVKEVVGSLIKKCRHLVASFNSSDRLARRLKEVQEEHELETKTKLIQDVPTRWNSTFDMLKSISINQGPLNSLKYSQGTELIREYIPTHMEFDTISDLCDLLEPVKVSNSSDSSD